MGNSDLLKHVQNIQAWTVHLDSFLNFFKDMLQTMLSYDMFSHNSALRITSLVHIFISFIIFLFETLLSLDFLYSTKEMATNYVLKDVSLNLVFAKLPVI